MEFRPNLLNDLDNIQLLERYRMDREKILYLLGLIEDTISPATHRSRSLSAAEKLMITLRFLASGTFQINAGDFHRFLSFT